MSSDSRLERAMEVFLDSQERGIARELAVQAHPELAELLGYLFDGEAQDDEAAGGERTFGDFRIRREISRGGMAAVYEASQRSLGRRVALKVLGQGLTRNPTQVARFRREATTLARLDHPHIVRVLGVGEADGEHWLAMELVDGEALDQHLQALRRDGGHRGASLRRLVETIAAIAEALQYVHEAGILHRDVKPANVLLRRDGHPLLGDFGLARDDSAPTVTQAGVIAGTPHYMSPEHLAGGDALTPASDVFSLGATLYECLTLQRPFDGGSNELVLHQILLHDPPDPRQLQRGLHADLAAVTLKAIEKDPARRYASAAAFAADLRAFLELRPVQARAPSSLQRLRRWARREPWRAAAAAVLTVLVAGAGWFAVQWPVLQAAAAARTAEAFEDALSLGWLERTSNHRDASLAAFREALQLRPHSAEAIAGLCMAMRFFDGGDTALAELDRRRPVADEPVLLERARVLMLEQLGRRDAAKALDATLPPPRTATDLWLSGTARMATAPDDPVAARSALDQLSLAVRLSPRPRLTMVVQWTIAAYRAKDQMALRECERTLLQLWPEHPFALHFAALALTEVDTGRAIGLCRQARARGMTSSESHWLEVSLLEAAGRRDELLAAVKATLAFPWDDQRRGVLVDQLAKNGDDAGEAAAVEAWYRQQPGSLEAKSRMGMLRCRREDFAGAVELLAEVAAGHPDDAEAHYNLAVAQHAAYLDADTRHSLDRTLTLAPDHARAHTRLLALLADHHDDAGQLAEHRRWAAACPKDVAARVVLAQALLQATPPDPAAALAAITEADYLTAGQDPAVLELKATVHEALGESGPARRCRAAAAQHRGK